MFWCFIFIPILRSLFAQPVFQRVALPGIWENNDVHTCPWIDLPRSEWGCPCRRPDVCAGDRAADEWPRVSGPRWGDPLRQYPMVVCYSLTIQDQCGRSWLLPPAWSLHNSYMCNLEYNDEVVNKISCILTPSTLRWRHRAETYNWPFMRSHSSQVDSFPKEPVMRIFDDFFVNSLKNLLKNSGVHGVVSDVKRFIAHVPMYISALHWIECMGDCLVQGTSAAVAMVWTISPSIFQSQYKKDWYFYFYVYTSMFFVNS